MAVTSTQLTGGQWIGPMVRAQNGGQNAYVGIYYWNNGSPDLMLFKRSGGSWTQLGSTYNSGALAAGTQLQVTGRRFHDLLPAERRSAHIGHRHQPVRRRAGHHVLRHRAGRQLVRRDAASGGTTYTVGGTVSGLSGTVVLQDNGGDNLSVSANGPFTFATALASGAAYSVTVKTNPSGQTCTVASGSGTIASANVTNVAVSCTSACHLYGRRDRVRADRDGGAAGQRRGQPQRQRQRPLHLRHRAGQRRRLQRHGQDQPVRPDLHRRQRLGHHRLGQRHQRGHLLHDRYQTTGSDNFNRANGSLGPNWTDISDGGLAIVSQAVAGTASAGVSGDIRTAESYTSDQYSQVTVTSTQLTGGQWIGPMVRAQNSGQSAYVGIYNWNNGSPELQLFKRNGEQLDPARQHLQQRGARRGDPAEAHGGRLHDRLHGEWC